MNLHDLGWPHPPQNNIVRITHRHKGVYQAINHDGTVLTALLSGNFEFSVQQSSNYPSVGDFCVCSPIFEGEQQKPTVLIQNLCERLSYLSRITSGQSSDQQVLAANIDYAFIVCSVVKDFNINRIHRYVLLAKQGKVTPIVVLSKIDLLDHIQPYLSQLNEKLPSVSVIASSTMDNRGINSIESYLKLGKTAVFIGSSGVGKSSLVNALLNKTVQKVYDVREDDQKGRHTTSSGSLFFLKSGGMIIDTPGLREVAVFADDTSVEDTFSTVAELIKKCQFNNCQHETEPGCAVLQALEQGHLDADTYENYLKLKREAAFSKRKMDKQTATEHKKHWKRIKQNYKQHQRLKNKQKN
ncbi:ribosome small subunit-dependent GTPase A [bacterium]|nr:ribosome small subunit-dependent GTPase A [bacterium]